MEKNSEIQRIAALVEQLARKHDWPSETTREVAQVIYDSRKACEEISYEEWIEYWKGKK